MLTTAPPPGAPPDEPAAPPAKRPRPQLLKGTTEKVETAIGDVFVTINDDASGAPFEVFAVLGKGGSVLMADVEAICRLASLALRFGIPIVEVFHQLRGISSDRTRGVGSSRVLSVPDAIAQAIGRYLARRPAPPT
jgi:ribonucleoside-diphosphate reductase alpha chain